MPHSIFGWSYPPGCNGVPNDEPDMSPQSEEVYVLLEDAGCSQELIDKVTKIIDNLAYEAINCPECERLANEAEEKFWKECHNQNSLSVES